VTLVFPQVWHAEGPRDKTGVSHEAHPTDRCWTGKNVGLPVKRALKPAHDVTHGSNHDRGEAKSPKINCRGRLPWKNQDVHFRCAVGEGAGSELRKPSRIEIQKSCSPHNSLIANDSEHAASMMAMYPARGLASIGDPGDMPFGQCRKLWKLFVVGNSHRVAPGQGQVIETARFAPWRRLESIENHCRPARICAILSVEY